MLAPDHASPTCVCCQVCDLVLLNEKRSEILSVSQPNEFFEMHIEDDLVIEHLTKNVSWFLKRHSDLGLQLRVYFELGVYQQVLHNTLRALVGLHETRVNQVWVI